MLLLLVLFGLALGAKIPSEESSEAPPVAPPVKLQRGNCPPFWYSFEQRCYNYVPIRMTWAEAEIHCLSHGANLVSIHSAAEDEFVTSLIRNFDPYQQWTWIGLSDLHREGSWMWSDGSPVRFEYWETRQPDNASGNENCVHKNFGSVKWNDNFCFEALNFVCATRRGCPIK